MPSTDEGRQSFSKGQGHWLPRWLLQPSISLFSLTSPILQLPASSLILAGHFLSSFLILPLLFFPFVWALIPFHLSFHEYLQTSLETVHQSH